MANFVEIPGYKVLGELGEGGIAKVYLGVQENLSRKVAIKVLAPFLLKKKEIAARFKKEAKTVAMLTHSNIVQIHDTGNVDVYHYIVMEYLEESLKERMKREPEGKIEPDIALEMVKEIMKGLDYAHFKGVLHRDVKPENIMFREDNTPVLVDFGIAQVLNSPEQLTRDGFSVGTIYYMSPEQCKAKKVDGRSDIYSLGVVLFEMLTGEKPYSGDSQGVLLYQHINKPVPKLPQELSQYQPLIDKLMAKDREERFSHGAEFVQLLEEIRKEPVQLVETFHQKWTELPYPAPEESSPPRVHKRDFTHKLPTRTVRSVIEDCLEFSIENLEELMKKSKKKLGPFRKKVKEKLDPIIDKIDQTLSPPMKTIKEKLKTIGKIILTLLMKKENEKPGKLKNYFIQKKMQACFIGIFSVLMVVLIIFISPSRKPDTRAEHPINLFISNFLNKAPQYQQYQKDLNYIWELYKKGDLESIREARKRIDELKKIMVTPGLKEVDKKVAKYEYDVEHIF